MATTVRVDGMAFSASAEQLRKELAQNYVQKVVDWVAAKKITSEVRINSTIRVFLTKAEEEFERKLHQEFPHPSYEPLISMYCMGSGKFFLKLQEIAKSSIDTSLALKV